MTDGSLLNIFTTDVFRFTDHDVVNALLERAWDSGLIIMVLDINNGLDEVSVHLRRIFKQSDENILVLCELNNTISIIKEVSEIAVTKCGSVSCMLATVCLR